MSLEQNNLQVLIGNVVEKYDMKKYYSGRFTPKNPQKYDGDHNNIVFRSHWERQVLRWCDDHPDIEKYSSEEIIVPYVCGTDGKLHRYFVDLKIRFKSGKTFLIEIKPKKETLPPKQPARKTRRYVTEVLTYVKNQSKWKAANLYAVEAGYEFQVWTEETLKNLGIRILT